MALFGTKKPDEGAAPGRPEDPARVGIDHVVSLMRTLPTDKHVDVVVTVLKTTLESLDIRVADIVADAEGRLKQIDGRVGQLETEIKGLEREIATRKEEIARMQAARAETAKVKDYLETEEAQVVSSRGS
ncbi:MAG TPA: hypothetical protein VIF62_33925 [Labilithrix sp.]